MTYGKNAIPIFNLQSKTKDTTSAFSTTNGEGKEQPQVDSANQIPLSAHLSSADIDLQGENVLLIIDFTTRISQESVINLHSLFKPEAD